MMGNGCWRRRCGDVDEPVFRKRPKATGSVFDEVRVRYEGAAVVWGSEGSVTLLTTMNSVCWASVLNSNERGVHLK